MLHDNADTPEQLHRKRNALTEDDIEIIRSIVESVLYTQMANQLHTAVDCRFGNVTKEELQEIVTSHRKFNTMMDDSKRTVRNVFIGLFITFVVALLTEGFWSRVLVKLKE